MTSKIAQQNKIPIRPLAPGDTGSLLVANNDRIYFLGKCNVTIGVEGAGFPVTMLIAERLPVPMILGRDFIRESGAQINGRTGWITFQDELVGTKIIAPQIKHILRASASVVIPPVSEAYVPLKIPAAQAFRKTTTSLISELSR